MKKLSLKMKGIGEMLTREHMKKVLGGDGMGGTSCTLRCDTNAPGGVDVASCSAAVLNTCPNPSIAVCNC